MEIPIPNTKYKYHPNIISIKEKINNQNTFSFKQVSLCDTVKKKLKILTLENNQP